jgi:hypothetical protein
VVKFGFNPAINTKKYIVDELRNAINRARDLRIEVMELSITEPMFEQEMDKLINNDVIEYIRCAQREGILLHIHAFYGY